MSNRRRDQSGRFTEEVTDQDLLKLFDESEEAFLTAPEIAERFGVTRQAISSRLKQMEEEGLVESKTAGANAVGWWATVAPRLSAETADDVERAREEIERGDTVGLEEL